jgi:CDP-2,3-bis-(O-geranylgeranyl)-sn-glycerol synthase
MEGLVNLEELGIFTLVLCVLWLYLPGYLVNTFAMMWGKWLPKTGYGPWPIDGGRIHKDGNRVLGDGKTWNGLIGGSLTSGLLAIFMVWIVSGNDLNNAPFVDISINDTGIGTASFLNLGWVGSAFYMGSLLGFFSLVGDSTGSFLKRRRGLKREGNVSSKAPLLDTLPFAIFTFVGGLILLPSTYHSAEGVWIGMLGLLILTPIIHRAFNILGYKLGWKDVPY